MEIKQITIPGFPGYAITEDGKVISLKTGRTLKPFKRSPGVSSVNLYKDGKLKCIRVAREVYRLFVGRITYIEDVIFKDGNTDNYHYTNLDKITKPSLFKKGYSGNSKLTVDEVNDIRNSRLTIYQLMKKYNRSYTGIRRIQLGLAYTHMPDL